MSVPPSELGIIGRFGEKVLPPLETSRLNPNETLLIPQPSFLANFAEQNLLKTYLPHLDFSPVTARLPSERERQAVAKVLKIHKKELQEIGENIGMEYDQTLVYLNHLIGWKKINLVRSREIKIVIDKKGRPKMGYDQIPELTVNDTVDLEPDGRPGETFTQDLFKQIGDFVFVNPRWYPNFPETERFILSPLGEGGKVLDAGKSLLVAEDMEESRHVRKHLDLLKDRGFRVGFLPLVDRREQPPKKRNFVREHIDGHSTLLLGHADDARLFFAESYENQGSNTAKKIQDAVEKAGANSERISDSRLPHLAFNVPQFRDKTVLLNASGLTTAQGAYEPNELETAVVHFLGGRFVHRLLYCVKTIPEVSQGSLRCLLNIAPNDFLQYLQKINK